MEDLKVDIKVEGDGKVVTLLTGEALEQKAPEIVDIKGNILAPGVYCAVRKPDHQKALVVFNRNSKFIRYEEDAVNHYGATITGTLKLNPELVEFNINMAKEYGTDALAKFLRMRKGLFAKGEECDALVKALSTLDVKVEKSFKKENDMRGNIKNHYDQIIKTDIPHRFKLKMPIFVGFDAKEFNVELYFDSSESGVRIYLESIELNDIIRMQRDIIMDEELNKLRAYGLAVMEE